QPIPHLSLRAGSVAQEVQCRVGGTRRFIRAQQVCHLGRAQRTPDEEPLARRDLSCDAEGELAVEKDADALRVTGLVGDLGDRAGTDDLLSHAPSMPDRAIYGYLVRHGSMRPEGDGTSPAKVRSVIVRASRPTSSVRQRSRRRAVLRAIVLVFVAAIMLGTLAAGLLALAIYHQARQDETAEADAIVVLGTAQFDGRPSPTFQARLDHARALFE